MQMEMNERLDKVNQLIEKVDKCYMEFCKSEKDGFAEFQNIVSEISFVFEEFLSQAEYIGSLGVEVPTDMLVQQLTNMTEACKNIDSVMLADTLRYEVSETLAFYSEIIKEMIKENISFKE